MTRDEIFKELNSIKDMLYDFISRVDSHSEDRHTQTQADLDFVALMTDIDLPSEEDQEEEE